MTNQRILLDVPLVPSIGSRFQPTGFPDLGHAEFIRPLGDQGTERCLLVESAQSMANHLEGTAWNDADDRPVEVVSALPYVRVLRSAGGPYVTSSRTEAHRLASAFIKGSMTSSGQPVIQFIAEQLHLAPDTPIDHRAVARALFRLDPFVLLHGVFFADKAWHGQPKISRAISGFVEASGVQRADSGGVKKDHVRHAIEQDSGGSSEGYGTVPFARTEWTARRIIASFNVDLRQIRSYGLGDVASDLLRDLALWEIRMVLDGGLRLRTACDLVPVEERLTDRTGTAIPSADELESRIEQGIAGSRELLHGTEVLEVVWEGGKKTKKGKDPQGDEQ